MKDWRHPAHSFRIPRQLATADLPPMAFRLALFLFLKAEENRTDTGDKSDCVTASYEDMIYGIRASRWAVHSALNTLIDEGWLFRTVRKGKRKATYIVQVAPQCIGMKFPRNTKTASPV